MVSFKGKTDNNAPSALLVCRGDSYRGVGKYALYMEIQNPGVYKIGSNVSVNLIGKDASVKVLGTIDLTGLSYYPVDYSGTITLNGADITFDYKQINTRETGNKPLNDEKRQHYRMQTGLLLNLIRTSTTNGTLKVENSTNSTSLSGSVGQIEGEGSGALIAGNMYGEVKDNKVYQAMTV